MASAVCVPNPRGGRDELSGVCKVACTVSHHDHDHDARRTTLPHIPPMGGRGQQQQQ